MKLINGVGLKLIIWCLTHVRYAYPFIPTLNFINDYKNHYYWQSYAVPENIYENWIVRMPFIVLEGYISALSISSFGILTLLAVIHGSVLTLWTHKLW